MKGPVTTNQREPEGLEEFHPDKTFEETKKAGNVNVGVAHNLPPDAMPVDYFCLLIPITFWTRLAKEISEYAKHQQEEKGEDKSWKDTTTKDMRVFLYIQYMIGLCQLPDQAMHWSSNPMLCTSAVTDVMGKRRMQKLSQYFHLNNNEKAVPRGEPDYDPLFKVRPS